MYFGGTVPDFWHDFLQSPLARSYGDPLVGMLWHAGARPGDAWRVAMSKMRKHICQTFRGHRRGLTSGKLGSRATNSRWYMQSHLFLHRLALIAVFRSRVQSRASHQTEFERQSPYSSWKRNRCLNSSNQIEVRHEVLWGGPGSENFEMASRTRPGPERRLVFHGVISSGGIDHGWHQEEQQALVDRPWGLFFVLAGNDTGRVALPASWGIDKECRLKY
jgi:hypothetical protein